MSILTSFKRSKPVVALYTRWLWSRCRSVEHFVFVATTGRSGSESLSRVFNCAPNVLSLHEPYPIMNEFDLDLFAGPPDRSQVLEDLKTIYVLRAAAGRRTYIETNHQFIKSFPDYAVRTFGKRLSVVHLVRDPVSIATSFYRIDSIPGKTQRGISYLLDPACDSNRVKLESLLAMEPGFDRDMTSCLWFWYEIQARALEFRQKYPNVPMHVIRTEQLNDFDALMDMFRTLQIDVDPEQVRSVVGTHANKRTEEKSQDVDHARVEALNLSLQEQISDKYGEPYLMKLKDSLSPL